MKTKNNGMTILLLLGVMGGTSCLNDGELVDKVDTVNATISPYTQLSGVMLSNAIIEGMSVKLGTNEDYSFFGFNTIDGFTYEGGFEYSVQLQRTTFTNPPADTSCHTYKLIRINSKVDKALARTETKMYVSGEMGTYKQGELTQDIPSLGMKYRESENKDWTTGPFNRIHGFDYEEGYDYVLTVKKTILTKDDAYYYYQQIQYKLIRIDSKVKLSN